LRLHDAGRYETSSAASAIAKNVPNLSSAPFQAMRENLETNKAVFGTLVASEQESEKAIFLELVPKMKREKILSSLSTALEEHNQIKSTISISRAKAATAVANQFVSKKDAERSVAILKKQLESGDILVTLAQIDKRIEQFGDASDAIAKILKERSVDEKESKSDKKMSAEEVADRVQEVIRAPLNDPVVAQASGLVLEVAQTSISYQKLRLAEVKRHLRVLAFENKRFLERHNDFMSQLMIQALQMTATGTTPNEFSEAYESHYKSHPSVLSLERNQLISGYWAGPNGEAHTLTEFMEISLRAESATMKEFNVPYSRFNTILGTRESTQATLGKAKSEKTIAELKLKKADSLSSPGANQLSKGQAAELEKKKTAIKKQIVEYQKQIDQAEIELKVETVDVLIPGIKPNAISKVGVPKSTEELHSIEIKSKRKKEAVASLPAKVGQALFVELPLDRLTEFEWSSELRLHSINLSEIDSVQRNKLVTQMVKSLELYYSGGIKPEEIARLAFAAAQAVGVVAIAADA
tara:strand:- start:1048 stop:2622 length:1575 start_codon:yes stop_codon:yes gene_type:complete